MVEQLATLYVNALLIGVLIFAFCVAGSIFK